MLNTTEVTPTMVRLLARSHEKMLDKLIFDPSQLNDPIVHQAAITAGGRDYSSQWLDKGPGLEHQTELLRAVVSYCRVHNDTYPAPPTRRVIDAETNASAAPWKEPRINLYQAFVGTGRLEAAQLVHLRSLETSLLVNQFPALGYEKCQLLTEAWEQAFYRKFPEFADGAAHQFEALALALQKAFQTLTTAVLSNAPIKETPDDPTAQ